MADTPQLRDRVSLLRTGALLALALVGAVALGAAPGAAQPPTTQYPGQIGTIVDRSGDGAVPSLRYRGGQRFDTARLIGEDSFGAATTDDVLIARADIFPDALSASFLAGNLDAPLLLTETRRLTPDTRDSLARLDPQTVTILGGTAAVSAQTEAALETEGYNVDRTGGVHRFETARLIATRDDTTVGVRDDDTHSGRMAIVARADEFPDALVAGSVGYAFPAPLLLTTGDTLHSDASAALDELDIDTVVVPGGRSAVSSTVVNQIENKGISVQRVSGVDRVATSVEFYFFLRDELGFDPGHVNMARGNRFPDALTLGPHAGEETHPIVLTANETTLGGAGAVAELLAETCEVSLLHVAGGHEAISPDLEQQMRTDAVDTGAICDIDFHEGDGGSPVIVNELGAETRTVEGTVVDNAGEPSVQQAEVRWQVFRGDFQQTDGAVELLDTGVATTTAESRFSFDYAAPDARATDYVVACTTDATTDQPGQAPDTCVEAASSGGVTVGDDQLLVADSEPQNIAADGLAWSYQIKQWGRVPVEPGEQPRPTIEFEGDLAVNPVDTEHTATATVRDADGDPVEGASVRFEVFRDDDPVVSEPAFTFLSELTELTTTNADGQATFTYPGADSPADDRIAACITDDDSDDPVCGMIVDTEDGQTVEPAEGEIADVTRKKWGFPAEALFARAMGVRAELLGSQLVEEPVSSVELRDGETERSARDADDVVDLGVEGVLRTGVLETWAAGDLDFGIAAGQARTADVNVLENTVVEGGSVLRAEAVDTEAHVTCEGQVAPADAATTRLIGAEVLGEQVPVEPDPNTTIEDPLGLIEVVLHEVESLDNGRLDTSNINEYGYRARGVRVTVHDLLAVLPDEDLQNLLDQLPEDFPELSQEEVDQIIDDLLNGEDGEQGDSVEDVLNLLNDPSTLEGATTMQDGDVTLEIVISEVETGADCVDIGQFDDAGTQSTTATGETQSADVEPFAMLAELEEDNPETFTEDQRAVLEAYRAMQRR